MRNINKHLDFHHKEGQAELTGYGVKRIDYTSDLYTKDAVEWITIKTNPFFLFLSYTAPHANNEAIELGAEHGMEVPVDYTRYRWYFVNPGATILSQSIQPGDNDKLSNR